MTLLIEKRFILQEKTAEESAKIPNCTGSESVHANMKACAMKKKVGLIEACILDQNRAVTQIAAYTGYLEGIHRGKGPTIFELAFRSADRVGSTKQFEEASNNLLLNIKNYDLLRTAPLNGDLKTRSVKQKGFATDVSSPIDSHRPDKVLITTPNTRGNAFRRCLINEDNTGQSSKQKDIIDLSDGEESMEPNVEGLQPNIEDILKASREDFQGGINISITESFAKAGMWQIRRWSKKGPGPQCNGVLGNESNRPECRCWVKREGIANRRGVAAVFIQWTRISYSGGIVPAQLWYCPNNMCFRGKERRGIVDLPPRPQYLPVAIGTSLTEEEILAFREAGLIETQRVNNIVAHPFELRINVNHYCERVNVHDPTKRLPTRDGKLCRQRLNLTPENVKRINSALSETMSVLVQNKISSGNGWGSQFLILTNTLEHSMATKYWVQICCFPTCSCDDFYKRHSSNRPYLTCKHIYWVYRSVFGLDLMKSTLVNQPILSVSEVQTLLDNVVQ